MNTMKKSISYIREKYQKYKKWSLITRTILILDMLPFLIALFYYQTTNQLIILGTISIIFLPIFLIFSYYLRYRTAKLKKQLNELNSTSNQMSVHPVKEITIKKLKFLQKDKQRLSNFQLSESATSLENKHYNNRKYCHVCGKKLEPDATYCKSCWADVRKK